MFVVTDSGLFILLAVREAAVFLPLAVGKPEAEASAPLPLAAPYRSGGAALSDCLAANRSYIYVYVYVHVYMYIYIYIYIYTHTHTYIHQASLPEGD